VFLMAWRLFDSNSGSKSWQYRTKFAFTHSYIHFLVMHFFTHEYLSAVLDFSKCCIALPLTFSVHWLEFLEIEHTILRFFNSNRHSSLVAHSWKLIRCMLKIRFRGCKKLQIVSKKLTVDPAASYSTALVDSTDVLRTWNAQNFEQRIA